MIRSYLARPRAATKAPSLARPALKWPLEGDRVRAVVAIASHIPFIAVTAYVFLIFNKRFYASGIGYDEEFFAWGGWCIRKGLAPYRDFIEFKPPLVFITHAIAQALCGFKNQGYRTFFAAFPLIAVLGLQASLVARGVQRVIAMATMLAIVYLFVNPAWHDTALSDCESIGMSYYMLGLALLLWEGRFEKVALVLGGFFMGCCVLSKEPFGAVAVCTCLGVAWLRGGPAPTRESVWLYARYGLLGVLVLALVLSLYMVPTGSMKAYFELLSSYSRIYRDSKRSYCVALGIFQPSTPLGEFGVAWDKARAAFVNETVLGYLAPLAVPGAVFVYRRSIGLFVTMALACAGALVAVTASKCQWVHYYNMTMAGIVFVLVAGVDSMKGAIRASHPRVGIAASVAAVTLLFFHIDPEFDRERLAEYHRLPWREPVPGVMAFIAQNTAPSDRIFTTGPPILYAQADRVSAIRESNIIDEILGSYDGSTDEERLHPIYLELVKNKPKVVVLDPEHGNRKVRHNRSLVLPYLAEFHYQKITDNIYFRP
jgi:hypothetical protein